MASQLTSLAFNLVRAVYKGPADVEVAFLFDKGIILIDDTFLYSFQIPNTGVQLGCILNVPLQNEQTIETCSNPFILNKLVEKLTNYENIVNSRFPSAQIDDFRAYSSDGINIFDDIYTNLRASDGCKFIKVNGRELGKRYLVPIYSSNPSLTKQDKLGLAIYEINDKYYMIKMLIYKKKINVLFNYYSRAINLDRPLR